jgi:hypothetical protein
VPACLSGLVFGYRCLAEGWSVCCCLAWTCHTMFAQRFLPVESLAVLQRPYTSVDVRAVRWTVYFVATAAKGWEQEASACS